MVTGAPPPSLQSSQLRYKNTTRLETRTNCNLSTNNRKIEEEQISQAVNSTPFQSQSPTALAVTRASLLSSNTTIRAQHTLLVPQNLSESYFCSSHETVLADEATLIHEKYRPVQSSSIKFNLDLSTVYGSSGGTSGGGHVNKSNWA